MPKSTLIATLALGASIIAPHAVAQSPSPDTGIVPAGSGAAMAGPATNFTGKVRVRPIVDATRLGRTSLGEVTFSPGARSNWHTHPGGQALYVLDGCGWTQREGGPITKICKGDTAYVPAGVKHWHGATAASRMTHLAVTEVIGGKNVTWMEPVSDQQYAAGRKDAP